MTDLDLRKIAEKHNNHPPHSLVVWANKDIAFLLDAVVEERANLRICQFRNTAYRVDLKLIPSPTGHYEKREWTDDDWRTQVLRELNLKDVWPIKEG